MHSKKIHKRSRFLMEHVHKAITPFRPLYTKTLVVRPLKKHILMCVSSLTAHVQKKLYTAISLSNY